VVQVVEGYIALILLALEGTLQWEFVHSTVEGGSSSSISGSGGGSSDSTSSSFSAFEGTQPKDVSGGIDE